MTDGIIIQAHVPSTRLPGKILKKIGSETVLEHIMASCLKAKVDNVIVATSSLPENKAILSEVDRYRFAIKYKHDDLYCFVYRGADNDVLSRYYEAATHYNLNNIIRITSDCYFISPDIINLCLKLHKLTKSDYTSFLSVDGLDTEVITMSALTDAYRNATTDYDREHVTPYLRNSTKFKKGTLESHKLSIDTLENFNDITALYMVS